MVVYLIKVFMVKLVQAQHGNTSFSHNHNNTFEIHIENNCSSTK